MAWTLKASGAVEGLTVWSRRPSAVDEAPAWLRWTWLGELPRDEAELRRFTLLFLLAPILLTLNGVLVLALELASPAVTGWRVAVAGGLIGFGLFLLVRERMRIRMAREHVASLASRNV